MVLLCSIYFSMLYVFYGRLQIEISQSLDGNRAKHLLVSKESHLFLNSKWKLHDMAEMKRRMLETRLEEVGLQNLSSHAENADNASRTTEVPIIEETCYLTARYHNRSFQSLSGSTMVYSAYLDERGDRPIVRIMAILGNYKKTTPLPVFCQFGAEQDKTDSSPVQGTLYELCENHGKKYGGFIISCKVPTNISSVCSVDVFQNTNLGKKVIKLPVTRLEPKRIVYWRKMYTMKNSSNSSMKTGPKIDKFPTILVPFNYSICVPPLFGKLGTKQFVEFVEIHRILGFQHFIFYVERLLNPEIFKVLSYYQKLNIVTVIEWHLPINGKLDIWYNGQLNAHNDCMYRAMSLSKYVAVIDIDEAIVPHDGHLQINESVESMFNNENVCALSFNSAFYSIKFTQEGADSDLITLSHLGRSEQFSTIRTKVLLAPLKVFEVGIHHVSKPLQENYKVLKVNQSTAFLHHYRKCVPNYGMKCTNIVEENTMLKYKKLLTEGVRRVFLEALSQNVFQMNATAQT